MSFPQIPSPVQEIFDPLFDRCGVRVLVKRDDLIHPELSGNKWRKLKFNLELAQQQGHTRLLTYGGAFSNHLAATAVAGKLYGFETIGVVRGADGPISSPTLKSAEANGMTLHLVDRSSYRNKRDEQQIAALHRQFGDFYRIPEGGSNELGVQGCADILLEVEEAFDVVCCACGTGTTLAGLIQSLPVGTQAFGFPVLKGGDFLEPEIRQLVGEDIQQHWSLQTDYHFGGYARMTPELLAFAYNFEEAHGFPLDPVYTAKLFWGVFDLMEKGFFSRGTILLLLHTGGLQGWEGMRARGIV